MGFKVDFNELKDHDFNGKDDVKGFTKQELAQLSRFN